MNSLRIVFMGTPAFVIPLLEEIIRLGHEVVCVYSQPPRPAGRGEIERCSPVHQIAIKNGLKIRTPKTLAGKTNVKEFLELNADIVFVVAYGLILPQPIIKIPKFGCINVHFSLLPRWRGAAPIQRAIEAGDTMTGVTFIKMNKKLDAGPIIHSQSISISEVTTSDSLQRQLCGLSLTLISPVISMVSGKSCKISRQSNQGVTYANKLSKKEGRLVWSEDAIVLERKVRAFILWPGTWFVVGGEKIKVLEASAEDLSFGHSLEPGTVIDKKLRIACGSGVFQPKLLQRPGRKKMPLREFINGFKIKEGAKLE